MSRAVLAWMFFASCVLLEAARDRELIGWQGETHTQSLAADVTEPQDNTPWVETVSWSPRVYVYHNFLTAKECLHLIHLAAPNMVKSGVVDSRTGGTIKSEIRTSSGTFLPRKADKTVEEIEQRIAEFTMIPPENGEGLQILHYEVGEKYDAHYDYFHDEVNTKNGGQRIATVLMYLTDVEEGGETVFPNGVYNKGYTPPEGLSECARKGVAVRPKRGDAILFWSLTPADDLDNNSLHAGCPIIRGDKWSATKWMRVGKYNV